MITIDAEPLLIGMTGAPAAISAEIAGSKAAQLWRMAGLGLEVPPAFVLPTTLCIAVNAGQDDALRTLDQGLRGGVVQLETATARRLGDSRSPLFVSVRSGAAKSMPGMLETILNVGLNDETVHGLIRLSGNPRLAWDSYRRFVQAYAEVVYGVGSGEFDRRLADMMRKEGVELETDLDPEALERLAIDFGDIASRLSAVPPSDPIEQLNGAALAVYRSWDSPRAREYRRLNKLDDLRGTAVTVQAMVFGNAGGKSGAGVAFSRNPSNGVNEFYLDFLSDAQGEDVVSGRRTPSGAAQLATRLPQVFQQLRDGAQRLERDFGDVQDIEFTVENGHLYFLQTRSAKRTPSAALRIAVDLAREGLIDVKTALARIADIDLDCVGAMRFDRPGEPVATAISASPGVASGRVALDSAGAKRLAASGEPVILVRPDTSTEDVAGFAVSAGILTAIGGRTAHAAVVARQLGKVCLVGCRTLAVDEARREATIGQHSLREGDWLSLDGERGEITLGRREIIVDKPEAELAEIDRWRKQIQEAKTTEASATSPTPNKRPRAGRQDLTSPNAARTKPSRCASARRRPVTSR
ncbi:MAG: pyruvate, phosphate dikinase [Bradyrhizobiaceae bacterium]|nr:pyruvate, phosphate dikinase [Bradyrhizobiaceae bacterium]